MGWSLMPNALRPFKTYYASPSITSQLVLFLWQTVEIDPLGHESCWSSPKICPEMRPCDVVRDSHSHSRCSTVSLPLRHILHKGFMSFPILCRWLYRPWCPVSRPITTDSCCLLMLNSLVALPCWGPSMRALECLQSLIDFQHSMCFLSIQSP
jgi:hypothetical protein